MPRPTVHPSVPSFFITPKRTFFGLDKQRAHCFTIPKAIYPHIEDGDKFPMFEWHSSKGNPVGFVIGENQYKAEIRRIDQDRSKTRFRDPEEFPPRIVYQFTWVKFPATSTAIQNLCRESFESVYNGDMEHGHRVGFVHYHDNIWTVIHDRGSR